MITADFADVVGQSGRGTYNRIPSTGWPPSGMYLHQAGEGSKPDIWLGDIGRPEDSSFDHYVERAKNFAKVASERILHQRGEELAKQGRLPVVAMNVLGSGDGGKRSQRGALLSALIPAFVQIAEEEGVDVILVCYGPVMYSAAQSVRRKVLDSGSETSQWSELDLLLEKKAKELSEKAKRGELVLFVGAGISTEAGIPAWKDFLQQIAIEGGLPEEVRNEMGSFDHRDQATILKKRLKERFEPVVKEIMSVEYYGLAHGLLASLPIMEMVTTNFDQLLESACRTSNRDLAVLPGDVVTFGRRWLLKLHGDVSSSIVLTRDDYHTALATQTALRGIVQAMLLTRHMLFIGYSLKDEDFHQLVHEVRSARNSEIEGLRRSGQVKEDTNNLQLGTALVLEGNNLTGELWGDVEFVDLGSKNSEVGGRYAAARRVLILLDRICLESTSELAFLTDKSFDGIKSVNEEKLSRVVGDLRDFLQDEDKTNPGSDQMQRWSEIRAFLERFSD